MTDKDQSKIDWSLTTWKGSRLDQHRKFLALPFRRKLEIIEQLGELAEKFHSSPTAREESLSDSIPRSTN